MVTWKAFIAFRTHFLRLRFGAKVRQPLEKCQEVPGNSETNAVILTFTNKNTFKFYTSQLKLKQIKPKEKKRTLTVFPE